MNIVVYPHDLDMGGSQINAIDLAAILRDRGHRVLVFGRPGVLVERIEAAGLEFVCSPRPRVRPTPSIVSALRDLIRDRRIDVLHGYEWPPSLEAAVACRGTAAVPVSTVLSMGVAPFLPHALPLMVGTEQMLAAERDLGRRRLALMEPPIDVAENAPERIADPEAFSRDWGLDPEALRLVVVSRLSREMKLEGILAAVEAVGLLGDRHRLQLIVVGGGDGAGEVAAAAERVNRSLDRRAVVTTGELVDPRPAYAAADIALGMGSSALRAMAFGKPLLVQGVDGYWEPLTTGTLSTFLWQGWYGQGEGVETGARRLAGHLVPLVEDAVERSRRGRLSAEVVRSRFSLEAAADRLERFYADSRVEAEDINGWLAHPYDDLRSAAGLLGHEVSTRWARWRRSSAAEDFNARSTLVLERRAAGAGKAAS